MEPVSSSDLDIWIVTTPPRGKTYGAILREGLRPLVARSRDDGSGGRDLGVAGVAVGVEQRSVGGPEAGRRNAALVFVRVHDKAAADDGLEPGHTAR